MWGRRGALLSPGDGKIFYFLLATVGELHVELGIGTSCECGFFRNDSE